MPWEHWVRTGQGLGAGVVQLPLHFGKQTRRGRFMPHIAASHPPGEGLGAVPGALAPSHELHDEVRTSARDGVAAPSPLRGNLSRFPKPEPRARRPPGSSPPARPAYLPGAAGGSRPPGPSVRAGPRRPGEPRCPRAGKDSLWASGPLPGRTSSAGRKTPGPRPRRRSRETGGGPPWPSRAAGGGGRVTRRRAGRRTPRGLVPPRPLPAGGSPRLTAGRSLRAASRVAAWAPGPRTLRPGPEPPTARRERDEGQREAGGGGESAAPRPYKERPGEGAGRGGEGGRGRKLPQEGAQVLPRGRRLRQGPPAPAPAAPARRGPPLPEHRPLMSFPDLPLSTPEPGCPRSDSPSPLRAKPEEVGRVPLRC